MTLIWPRPLQWQGSCLVALERLLLGPRAPARCLCATQARALPASPGPHRTKIAQARRGASIMTYTEARPGATTPPFLQTCLQISMAQGGAQSTQSNSLSADHPAVPRPIGIDSHSTLCTSMPTMRKMPSLSAEPCSGVFRNVCDRRLDPNERSESSHSAYLHARTHARTSMHPQTHARAHMHVHTCTRTHGRTHDIVYRVLGHSHSAVVCGRESLTHPHHRQ